MNIWIINPYGSLPDESWRTYRSTMIANALQNKGHRVVQFISNFEHRSKSYRTDGYSLRKYGGLYDIHIIPSKSYSSHISLDRVRYERSFGRNLIKYAVSLEKPDVVILAEPAICYYDTLLSWLKNELKTKIVIDLIDIWPELFHLLVPKPVDFLARIALSPLYYWRKRLYRNADGIVAVSKNYLDIAKKIAPFKEGMSDVVYWSIPNSELAVVEKLQNHSISEFITKKNKDEVWCIYAGTLGENYDIKSIIEAANMIKDKHDSSKFKLFIAGDGPLSTFCKNKCDDASLVFLGRLSSTELAGLYGYCDFALSTYKGRSTVAMPIKAFDYFAFGLPIINSLGRDLGNFVATCKVGINYKAENIEELYRAMSYLIENKVERLKMRDNALKLSLEFAEKEQYLKFINVLEKVKKG
jgi:glycosyltransferase involved in cell wall biosynthesis